MVKEGCISVAVRMTREEARKLDELARKTERDRSKVLRWLVAQAHAMPTGELALNERTRDARTQ
jgi:predicted transcriptional regulator